jgi:uncharacterized protein
VGPEKAEHNLSWHGVAFTEAMTVFGDPLEITIPDAMHSDGVFRFLSLHTSEGFLSWPILSVEAESELSARERHPQGATRL